MSDWFDAELKKLPGGLHLRRSSLRNRAAGYHPDCWQVWAIGEVSREPYLVTFLTDGTGKPRNPCSKDIDLIRGLDKARDPRINCADYVSTQLARIDYAAHRATEKGEDLSREWFRSEMTDDLMRRMGRRKTVPVKQPRAASGR